MGKIDGIFQFTGKIGQVVGMKGRNGQNYSRVMVKPANPKSATQNITRIKMSLSGQLSKLTPAELIVGMQGNSKVEKRSRYVRNIMQNAMTTAFAEGSDELIATLNVPFLKFSEGRVVSVQNNDITVVLPTDARVATVTCTENAFNETKADSILVILVCGKMDDLGANMRYNNIETVTINSSSAGTGFGVDVHAAEVVVAYCIPIFRTTAGNNLSYMDSVIDGSAEGYKTLATLRASGAVEYGASQYLTKVERQ